MTWRIWVDGERQPNLTLKDDGTRHHYTLMYGAPGVTTSALSGLVGDPTNDDTDEADRS